MKNPRTYQLISSKTVFGISLLVAALTIIGIYFWGLGVHRTFFENSILSTTILSITFFLFITIGLYRGVKLKDNLGKITGPKGPIVTGAVLPEDLGMNALFLVGEATGIQGVLFSILLWILCALAIVLATWLANAVVLVIITAFAGMLYWIFFRALRLVFENSNKSKGKLIESIRYGITYTILYNFWIYGVLMLIEFVSNNTTASI